MENPAAKSGWKWGIYLLALVYSMARTLRLPNDWSEAHWLISYDLGLVKRAFVGSGLKPIVDILDTQEVELMLITLSFGMVALFVIFLWKISLPLPMEFGLALLLSPVVLMMFHLNGYFDYLLFLIGWGAMNWLKKDNFWVSSILLSLGILIHESCLFIVFPAVAFGLFLKFGSGKGLLVSLVKVFAIPSLILMILIFFTDRHSDSLIIQKAILNRLAQFPFVASKADYVAYSFTHSFMSYFKLRLSFLNPVYFPVFLNVLAAYLFLGRGLEKQGKIVLGVVLAFPLLLHLIAVDTGRIWIYPLLVGMLILYFRGVSSIYFSRSGYIIGVGLIVINAIYTLPLMDELNDRILLGLRIPLAVLFLGACIYSRQTRLADAR